MTLLEIEEKKDYSTIQVNKLFSSTLIRDLFEKIYKQKICIIIGGQNSGKTSLIYLLLCEIPCGVKKLFNNENQMILGKTLSLNNSSISYASQEPWIFTKSVMDNIVYQEKFNANRYIEVNKYIK